MGLGESGPFPKKKKATCLEPDMVWGGGFLKLVLRN